MAEKYVLNSEQQKLVEEHLDLVDILLHTRIRPNHTIRGMEYDELFQCGCLALCKAAATYDGSTKFPTYASHVVYNSMIDQCRRAKMKYDFTLSYDAPDSDNSTLYADHLTDSADMDEELQVKELEAFLVEAKNFHHGAVLRGIEAIELQIKGYSGPEIAKMYGVKNNNVSNWISKARAVLKLEYKRFQNNRCKFSEDSV